MHPQEYIYALYIDDGVSDRRNRKSIVSPRFMIGGVAHCKDRKSKKGILVVSYAEQFTSFVKVSRK